MTNEKIVICEVCGEGDVNEPCLDYCHVCNRKLCDDCIAAFNAEHGLRFCEACHILETLDLEAVLYGKTKDPTYEELLADNNRLRAELAAAKAAPPAPAAIVWHPRCAWEAFENEDDAWEYVHNRYDCESPKHVMSWTWHPRKQTAPGDRSPGPGEET